MHSTVTLIRSTLIPKEWTHFTFRTTFILCGILSTRCRKLSSQVLVHIDTIASRDWYRFVSYRFFHHIPKVLCWTETWRPWRPLEYSELIVQKPVGGDLSFVTGCIILLEVTISRWSSVVIKGLAWPATIVR